MTELLHGPWPEAPRPPRRLAGRSGSLVGSQPDVREMEERVAELRREAVFAVVRQGEIKTRLLPLQERARLVEEDAARALGTGDEGAARGILAREMPTLVSRDALAQELLEAQRLTIQLLKDAVRLQELCRRIAAP